MAIERMTVTVPAEMAGNVRAAVDAGDYASSSEVVRDALRDWSRQRRDSALEVELLREAIRAGDDSGATIPAAEVFAELRALIARKRAAGA